MSIILLKTRSVPAIISLNTPGPDPNPWTPFSEPGLILYLDSDLGFTPALWTDQSPAHNNATQGTFGKQPSRVISGQNIFNGHSSIAFNGSQWMQHSVGGGAPRTIAFFGQCNMNSSYRCAVMCLGQADLYTCQPGNVWGQLVFGTPVSTPFRTDMFRRLISVCAAANDITLYTDGTGDHRTNGLSFNPSPAGFVGTDFDPAFGPFIGNITGVIIYDHALTPAVVAKLDAWALARWGQALIVTDGNSLVHGYNPPATTSILDLVAMTRPAYKQNNGVGGNTTTNMIATGPTLDDLLFYPGTAGKVLIGMEVRNDVVLNGQTANQAIANVMTWMNARRAAAVATGARVLWATCAPSNTLSDVTRNAVNDSLAAQLGIFPNGDFIDFRTDPLIGVNGACFNATYFPDFVHPSDAGNAVFGGYFAAAANAAMTTQGVP